MDNRVKMDQFLASVQNRAFQMARMALSNDDDALDVVQDTMIKLVQKYSEKSEQEWTPLFYRILQSRIYDVHRKNTVKRKFFGIFGVSKDHDDESEQLDPIQTAEDEQGRSPEQHLQDRYTTHAIVAAVEALPIRQQQTFTLRLWEGLSVAETAAALNISEGSVKTHLSRALSALRIELEDHWL